MSDSARVEVTLSPDPEFRAGTRILEFTQIIEREVELGSLLTLDLSNVVYMDSASFRLVFDLLPQIQKLIPPPNPHIVMMYNQWLDSKKGLSK